MQAIRSFRQGHDKLFLFLTAVIGFLIPYLYLLIANVTETYYDAWVYVEHAKPFMNQGLFNLGAYAEAFGTSYRGYLLPWLIALGDAMGKLVPCLNYRFLISVLASVTCTIALPGVIESVFQVRFSLWKRPVLLLPLIYFFSGTMIYPLSDLWAAGMAILAVWALTRFASKAALPLSMRLLPALLCGAALAAAYNIRTINLILLFSVGACAVVYTAKIPSSSASPLQKLLILAAIALGFLLVSLPQMLINWQCSHSLSPLLISNEGSSLFINQLYDGIYTAKYESYVGGDYWKESMTYLDRGGLALFEQLGFEATGVFGTGAQTLSGIGDYIALVIKYPLDFIGIYARHLINLLDIRYPEIYVETIFADHIVPVVNYLLLYGSIAAVALELRIREKGTFGGLWLLGALLLPTAAILAGAIETRFSIVLMLVLWGCLMGLTRRKLFTGLRARSYVALALGLVAFFLIMTAVGGDTMAGFSDWTMLY